LPERGDLATSPLSSSRTRGPIRRNLSVACAGRHLPSSWPGLTRLRGRSPFGAAKARPSAFLAPQGSEDVDARDKRGHDEPEFKLAITPCSRGMFCPSFARSPSIGGRRECRALSRTRSLVCEESRKNAHELNHRSAEIIRHSLRNGLRLITRSPRGAGLDSPRRLPVITGSLDPSIGGSGPHAFAVRAAITRQLMPHVHRNPHHVS
jgi:hypothetical protein